MWLYAYLTRITLHGGGLKNGKNGGEPNGFCLVLSSWKRSMGNLRRVAPLCLNYFGRFSILIPPCLFTVHVRPVLSPCQAGNTCYISTCVSNSYTIDNIINTICTHNVYGIMLAPLFLLGITGFCSTNNCSFTQ